MFYDVDVTVSLASAEDLPGIVSLHTANHIENLTQEEREREGFVTAKYTLEDIAEMHEITPPVIAKSASSGVVVGYALVVDRTCPLFQHHELMQDFLAAADQVVYKGRPLGEQKYVIVGQLCVAKEYRGKGVVGLLYSHYRECYAPAGYQYCVTDVSTENPRSLRAHVKAGFIPVQKFRYSGSGWDIILYDWTTTNAT